jgi:Class III cytochrome C family
MRKIGFLYLLLSMGLVFGSITIVVGQETETEMVVPMAIIEIVPPDSVEPVRTPVEFPHSRHFASVDCRTCHHKWNGTDIIAGCTTTDCHDVTVSPTKSGNNKLNPDLMIKYYKTAYHKKCIGCHKEIKAQNKQLEASFKELKDKLPPSGPTSCIQCHPKE